MGENAKFDFVKQISILADTVIDCVSSEEAAEFGMDGAYHQS